MNENAKKLIEKHAQHLPNCNLLSLIPLVSKNGAKVGCDCGLEKALSLLDEPVCKTCGDGKELIFYCSLCGTNTHQFKEFFANWKKKCIGCMNPNIVPIACPACGLCPNCQ